MENGDLMRIIIGVVIITVLWMLVLFICGDDLENCPSHHFVYTPIIHTTY